MEGKMRKSIPIYTRVGESAEHHLGDVTFTYSLHQDEEGEFLVKDDTSDQTQEQLGRLFVNAGREMLIQSGATPETCAACARSTPEDVVQHAARLMYERLGSGSDWESLPKWRKKAFISTAYILADSGLLASNEGEQ